MIGQKSKDQGHDEIHHRKNWMCFGTFEGGERPPRQLLSSTFEENMINGIPDSWQKHT
jgi:hypothetical protein